MKKGEKERGRREREGTKKKREGLDGYRRGGEEREEERRKKEGGKRRRGKSLRGEKREELGIQIGGNMLDKIHCFQYPPPVSRILPIDDFA